MVLRETKNEGFFCEIFLLLFGKKGEWSFSPVTYFRTLRLL